MTKKKIILTFDYELYLGEDSGTIEKCMIEPTNKILKILKKYNFKGLFFVDATFLVILKKDFYDGYLKIKEQILNILKNGNDVGLHIHPHWIDSYMITQNRWSFKSYDNFRIHNLSKEKLKVVIHDSYIELDSICKEFSKDYKIDSFRAGGWCIQPFGYIKDELKDVGIKYDFSVLRGMKKKNLPKHYYDYTNAPDKSFWHFEDDVLKEVIDGSFIEIPTTIVKMNLLNLFKLKKQIRHQKTIGDGKGADASNDTFIKKLKKLKPFIKHTLSSDYMTLGMFEENIKNTRSDILVYVSHPKIFSYQSFEILTYICTSHETLNYKEIR